MRILVISTSLKPFSRSRIMARACFERVLAAAPGFSSQVDPVEVEWLDLNDVKDVPFCDASDCWTHPTTGLLRDTVERADGIILASPVYNYDVSAAAKNLVELTGRLWEDKVVGFVNAAGGTGSYMSVLGLANSLMLDFRCLIVPRFVYATGRAFDGEQIADEDVRDRIDELARTLLTLTDAVVDRG